IRGGREWVPAILRYNRIPARALVEVGNLNNAADRKLLATRAFRDRVARALVSAFVDFYGGKGSATVTAEGKRQAAGSRQYARGRNRLCRLPTPSFSCGGPNPRPSLRV